MTAVSLIKLTLFATIIGIAYSVGIYEQCMGDGYATYPCDAGLACFRRNRFYSSCQYGCPRNQGWECEIGLPPVPITTVAVEWDQCGGDGWLGARVCPAGYACYQRSVYYAQCRPINDCPAAGGWSCTAYVAPTSTAAYISTAAPIVVPAVLPAYSRCNDVGNAVCATGTGCFRFSATYSECRYYCPAGWACETDVVGADGQCAGEDYVGITRCAAGLACYQRTKWFSQCAAGCPGVDWVCPTATN